MTMIITSSLSYLAAKAYLSHKLSVFITEIYNSKYLPRLLVISTFSITVSIRSYFDWFENSDSESES